ncbi:MAG: hypothetical protein INF91_03840 [Alphaproteobacteria bacterium]|nr:hypothetical protein [Alphaproteobacteria bacterium]
MQEFPTLVRVPRQRSWRRTKVGVGVVLMTFGPALGWPLPGPVGIVSFAAGLTLVLQNSRRARRRYVRWAKHNPRWGAWTNRALRRSRQRVPLPEARQKPYHRPHPR